MRRIAYSLVMMLFVAVAFSGRAASDENTDREYWRKEFTAKRAALVAAQEEFQAAKLAQRKQRRRDYPQGKREMAIDQAVKDTRQQVETAKTEYLQVFDRARQAGAEPGWYRDFEDELPTLIREEELDTETQFPEESNESSDDAGTTSDLPSDTNDDTDALDLPSPSDESTDDTDSPAPPEEEEESGEEEVETEEIK